MSKGRISNISPSSSTLGVNSDNERGSAGAGDSPAATRKLGESRASRPLVPLSVDFTQLRVVFG
jgi:hypothetical protein